MGLLINPQQSIAPLLARQNIEVGDVGDTVTMKIGNYTLTLHYESALQASQMLRLHAKRAKKRAGDGSRHWSAVGLLEGLK